jgi:hypothetical protein
MEEKDLKEMNEESRARGVKRSSETKIAEVSTGKKKRVKKPASNRGHRAQNRTKFF